MTARATRPPAAAVVPEPHPDAPPPGTPLGSHYARCFGCGGDHPTGLHLAMRAEEGVAVTAELTVTDDHRGAGLAHLERCGGEPPDLPGSTPGAPYNP